MRICILLFFLAGMVKELHSATDVDFSPFEIGPTSVQLTAFVQSTTHTDPYEVGLLYIKVGETTMYTGSRMTTSGLGPKVLKQDSLISSTDYFLYFIAGKDSIYDTIAIGLFRTLPLPAPVTITNITTISYLDSAFLVITGTAPSGTKMYVNYGLSYLMVSDTVPVSDSFTIAVELFPVTLGALPYGVGVKYSNLPYPNGIISFGTMTVIAPLPPPRPAPTLELGSVVAGCGEITVEDYRIVPSNGDTAYGYLYARDDLGWSDTTGLQTDVYSALTSFFYEFDSLPADRAIYVSVIGCSADGQCDTTVETMVRTDEGDIPTVVFSIVNPQGTTPYLAIGGEAHCDLSTVSVTMTGPVGFDTSSMVGSRDYIWTPDLPSNLPAGTYYVDVCTQNSHGQETCAPMKTFTREVATSIINQETSVPIYPSTWVKAINLMGQELGEGQYQSVNTWIDQSYIGLFFLTIGGQRFESRYKFK